MVSFVLADMRNPQVSAEATLRLGFVERLSEIRGHAKLQRALCHSCAGMAAMTRAWLL